MLAVQHFNILIKLDDLVPMTFKQVFWCYWIFMTVLNGVLTLCIIAMISNSYIICVMIVSRSCPEKSVRNCFALIGGFSVLLATFLYCFGGFTMELYNFLDSFQKNADGSERKPKYDPLFHCLSMGWLFATAIVTGFGGRTIRFPKKRMARKHTDQHRRR